MLPLQEAISYVGYVEESLTQLYAKRMDNTMYGHDRISLINTFG